VSWLCLAAAPHRPDAQQVYIRRKKLSRKAANDDGRMMILASTRKDALPAACLPIKRIRVHGPNATEQSCRRGPPMLQNLFTLRHIFTAALILASLPCARIAPAQDFQASAPNATSAADHEYMVPGLAAASQPGSSFWANFATLADSDETGEKLARPGEGGEGKAAEGDKGAGEGKEHESFDRIKPFSEREKTAEGYSLLEAIKTDPAFLQRYFALDFLASKGGEAGSGTQAQFSGELEWAINITASRWWPIRPSSSAGATGRRTPTAWATRKSGCGSWPMAASGRS
jgi:hypothetical protein